MYGLLIAGSLKVRFTCFALYCALHVLASACQCFAFYACFMCYLPCSKVLLASVCFVCLNQCSANQSTVLYLQHVLGP